MAVRNRQVSYGSHMYLSNAEMDLVAQALDNYHDSKPEGDPAKPMIATMVEFFNSTAPNGSYEFNPIKL